MPKRPFQPDDLLRLQVPGDPRVAPDGKSVVYTVKRVSKPGSYATDLYLWRDGDTRRLTSGESSDTHPRWRPDGAAIAFMSNRLKPKAGLFLLPADGGEATPLLELPEGSLSGFDWSPDGKRIAFLYRPKSEERTESAKEKRKETGESEPPLVVDTLIWRLDGDGVFGPDRYRLCVLDVSSGEYKTVVDSAAEGEYSYCWAGSDRLVVSYNESDNPTMEQWREEVFLVDLSGKQSKLDTPVGNKSSLTALSDSRVALAFSDRSEERFGYKVSRLCFLDVDTGDLRDPWQDRDDLDLGVWTLSDVKEPGGVQLSADNGKLFGSISRQGFTHVVAYDDDGNFTELTETPGEWTLYSAQNGVLAATHVSPTELPEIVVFQGGQVVHRSDHNAELTDDIEFVPGEEMWVESEPGVRVQAWVLRPHGFAQGKKYPACIEVHGGPHGMYTCGVFLEMQNLAGAGYVVVWSNPRGSTGYGEEFARCIKGDWGNKDWIDVQAVTAAAKALPYVDPDRVAILGGSYGGYMVNWAIGHSNEYKCAITDRCVANLLSKSGNSDYTFVPDGNWPGSAFRGDWETLWEKSPVKHFGNVTTPTLVIHSEGDLRCHIEQGEQVYTFLKMHGVPTKFVRYPATTSHGMSRSGPTDLRVHRLKQQLEWFGKHL